MAGKGNRNTKKTNRNLICLWTRCMKPSRCPPESTPGCLVILRPSNADVSVCESSSLLSSHALGIILNTCPHHLTLISILLDETLTHKLDHEATQLLEALLLVAYRPKPNGVAPVCHNAHSKFVTELLERWLNAGYTTLAFTTVLIRVLCEVQNKDIWTSRAMDNLLRRLYHLDVSSFLCVTTELANHLSSRRTLRRQSILKDQGTEELSDLSHCLCQWYRYAIERLCASSKEDVVSSYNDAIFEFIQTSTFVLALETTSAPTALKDSLASLALIWLSGNHDTAPLTHLQRVTDLLSSYKPQPSTFHELVKQTFSGKPIGDTRQRLRIWASCLRKHKLNTLEASLWGSTLFAVENLEGDIHLVPHERAEVKAYRQQVMEYVDEAESNLFQAPSCTPMRSATKSYSPLRDYPTVPQSPWSKGGWKWEPVVGSWVKQHNPSRPSPSAEMAVKRRRVTFATPKKISSALTWDTPDTGSCTSLTPRPKFRPRYTPRHEKKLPSLSLSTSSTNFTSIVAKAVSQRTVLHPVDINERRRSLVEDSGGHWESSPIAPRRLKGHHPEPHQASDDVLDLLASPSTSPTRPW